MALTAGVQYSTRGMETQSFPIANGVTLYQGAYCAINTAGYLVNVADTTAFEPVGFLNRFSDQDTGLSDVGDTSASPVPEGAVDIGGRIVSGLTVTGVSGQTDVSALVYATDENTFTLSATSNIPAVGAVVRYTSNTDVDVLFFSFDEMRNN